MFPDWICGNCSNKIKPGLQSLLHKIVKSKLYAIYSFSAVSQLLKLIWELRNKKIVHQCQKHKLVCSLCCGPTLGDRRAGSLTVTVRTRSPRCPGCCCLPACLHSAFPFLDLTHSSYPRSAWMTTNMVSGSQCVFAVCVCVFSSLRKTLQAGPDRRLLNSIVFPIIF